MGEELGTPEGVESAEELSGSDVNWEDLNDDFSSDGDTGSADEVPQVTPADGSTVEGDVVVPEKVVPVTGGVAAPATPVQPAQPVTLQPQTPVAPVAAPMQPQTPVQQQQQQPRQPAPTAEALAAWEGQQLSALEQYYKLPDDMRDALMTEPEVVMPRILARAHLDITRSVVNATRNLLPEMFQELTHSSQAESQAKNLFYSVNADLNKPEYERAIFEFGAMYRRVNPTAPPEEAVKRIGDLVRNSLGLAAPVSATAVAPQQQTTPERPFTPARGGTSGQALVVGDNEFTRLNAEFDASEY